MNGLVDYGSGSDSEEEEEQQQLRTDNMSRATIRDGQLGLQPEFDSNDMEDDEFGDVEKMKAVSGKTEEELEEIVKPKEWERKLAEKARKKLKKKAKKEKRKGKGDVKTVQGTGIAKPSSTKSKPRAVISAFGALGKIVSESGQLDKESSSDSEDDVNQKNLPSSSASSGFLSFLPAPKAKAKVTKTGGLIVPPSITRKQTNPVPTPAKKAPLPPMQHDSESEEDDSEDFFGLAQTDQLSNFATPYEIPSMPSDGRFEEVGPSRPLQRAEMHPSAMYNAVSMPEHAGPSEGKRSGIITDEDAHRLIMQHAHDIGEGEGRSYNEMVQELVDVNVQQALGPNVQANLLKNLTHKALAESRAAPLPNADSKSAFDPNARRKHQITYLAKMAVDRDAALQEKWAEARQNKRMAKQKYGF